VFFRCLVGRLPFDSSTTTGMLGKIVAQRAPWFAEACPILPRFVALALDRALEPKPARRYQDMRSFAEALTAACVQEGVALHPRLEPLGLPKLEEWLRSSHSERTRSLTASAQPLAREHGNSKARPSIGRRHAWLLLAPIGAGALALAVSSAGPGSMPPAQAAPLTAAASTPSPADEQRAEPFTARLVQEPAAGALPAKHAEGATLTVPSVHAAVEPSPAPRPKRTKRRAAPALVDAAPSAIPPAAPAPARPVKPSLITSWSVE
jgi:hypothetical protein